MRACKAHLILPFNLPKPESSAKVMPDNVQMPPSWNLTRLSLSTCKHWWQAAWSGIAEITVLPSQSDNARVLILVDSM